MVLRNPAAHVGKEYALTGLEAVACEDVAEALVAVAGRPVKYEAVAPKEFETRLRAAGMPDWRAYDLAHIASAYGAKEGRTNGSCAPTP
jgi:uncharacterized protein YbjT (DUF2867 family)